MAIGFTFLPALGATAESVYLASNRFISLIVLNGGYLYAMEVFPTRVRGKGIGLCSVFGCLGKVLAYLLTNLGHNYTYIFGTIGLIGIISLRWLPGIPDMGFHALDDEIPEVEATMVQK